MIAILTAGVILTLAGWYGPEDEGLLATIGLILIAIAVVGLV